MALEEAELGCSSSSSAVLLCKAQESHGVRRVSCYAAESGWVSAAKIFSRGTEALEADQEEGISTKLK